MNDDIVWGHLESDDPPWRDNECKKCGCVFIEVYKYHFTEYNKESKNDKA